MKGAQAYLIKGGWVRHVNPDGQVQSSSWSSDISIGIVFQKGDRWIEIQAAPYPKRNGFTEAELIKVAKSVNTYDHVTGS